MIAAPLCLCLLIPSLSEDALSHLQQGRYEEALEALEQSDAETASPVLLRSRVLIETGRYGEAKLAVDAALAQEPRHADLLVRRGELHLLQGDYENALADAKAALAIDADHPGGHWCKADALTELGRIDEANEECRWFIRFYNRKQPNDAETLVYVAKGSLRYARWNRANSIFHFVINELCPDIAKDDPQDWRADAISGALLVEKYNDAQGLPDLKRALTKNPSAATVHAQLAAAAVDDFDFDGAAKHVDRALAVNPVLVPALGIKADLALAEGDLDRAQEALATALAVNPNHQELLARQAALEVFKAQVDSKEFATALDAIKANEPSKLDLSKPFHRLISDLLQRNPKPGYFLNQLGNSLELRRSYSLAERTYACAMAVMPELSEPQVSLGLLSMRAGDLDKAGEILEKAFKADPFNIRVNNMRKVIGLLKEYETVETEHFIVRFDTRHDRVLAELMVEYLESIYPELTREFGFEPPEKTTVELFQSGSGQSGHEWFSARMVGLPWIQTIGASTGLMFAFSSPTELQQYNWARVARHEFVHVITLQQTDFRIPHWYTEALAVRSEGTVRPEEWDELLRKRVPKGQLLSLDELNAAFIRPKSPADWQFAYCQSLLYAQYLDRTFGPAIHGKLLDGYARGLSTDRVVEEALDITAKEFDEGYRTDLAQLVNKLGPPSEPDSLPEEASEALRTAATAIRRKDFDDAIATLTPVYDESQPVPQVLELLGKLELTRGNAEAAAKLFSVGRQKFPHETRWLKLHVAALLKAPESPELKQLLEQLAERDPDDGIAARKLAELSAAAEDWDAAKQWALRALYVTPREAELHDLLATACQALGQTERAETAQRHAKLLRETDDSVDEQAE